VSKLKRALVSVADKSGIAEFARALAALGVTILSTGGTAKLLEKEGVPVTEVAAHTGFPEMLDGRVKTLHPKIHGGLLARRDDPVHLKQMKAAGIEPIDLVVVNLYPFQATVADPDCRLEDAIENIDIGGPAMLRSAAKNHAAVAVVVDPSDYARVLEELRAHGVRAYEYQPAMIHAKTMVVDGVWGTIGSMNFDNRSLTFNDESSLVVLDPEFGAHMESVFCDDLRLANEMTPAVLARRDWWQRLLERGAVMFSHIL